MNLAKEKDFYFNSVDTPGPIGLGRGNFDEKNIKLASQIIARYSDKSKEETLKIAYGKDLENHREIINVTPAPENELHKLRV